MPIKPRDMAQQQADATKETVVRFHQGMGDEPELEAQADPDPIREIAYALIAVAKGASVIELRKVVVENAFEDRKQYVAQIKRMRDAADTALTLAQELASGV